MSTGTSSFEVFDILAIVNPFLSFERFCVSELSTDVDVESKPCPLLDAVRDATSVGHAPNACRLGPHIITQTYLLHSLTSGHSLDSKEELILVIMIFVYNDRSTEAVDSNPM